MNGHAPSKHALADEESMALLEEKSLSSDVESDSGRSEFDARSKLLTLGTEWRTIAYNSVSTVRSTSWRSLILRTGFFLLPSFLQSRISRDPRLRSPVPERLGPTAYLDGMRGLAALFVFFCHYFYTCFVIAEGWGYGEHNYHFLKLPIVRLFYQGPPMVCVFFVISGYALSLKPLRLMRARNMEGFATAMTSFTFRRGFRLFLPTATSTLMIVVMIRLGLYEWTRDFATDARYMKNVQELHYQRFPTAAEQLADWGGAMFDFVHVWGWEKFGGSTGIDPHLWTIPVEFRGSMVLFLVLIGLARARTAVRLTLAAVVMWFTLRSDRWEMLLFLCGMVLAEVDLIRGVHNAGGGGGAGMTTVTVLPTVEPSLSLLAQPAAAVASPVQRGGGRGRAAAWLAASVIGLYLMSQPDQGFESTPGWVFLSTLIPEWFSDKYRFWQCVGAVIFVLAVGRSPAWQRVFNTGPVQYFGKISYALYLMHGPVLHTVGYAIERWMWSITGIEGSAYNLGFVLASFFIVPIVIWAADVFWRAVDAPVVKFSKWIEAKCSV